jgi:hypothetical protein
VLMFVLLGCSSTKRRDQVECAVEIGDLLFVQNNQLKSTND